MPPLVPACVAIDRRAASTRLLAELQVHTFPCRRRHHGEAFWRPHVYLPPRVAQSLAGCRELTDPGRHTTSTVIGLIESHGNDIAEAEQVVTATAADEKLAERLGCTAGVPILHIERTYLDRRGAVLEHAVSDFLPQHYSHRSRLGRSLAPDTSPVLLQE